MELRLPLPDSFEGLIVPPPPPPAPIVKNIYNLTEEGSRRMARNHLIESIFGMTLLAGGLAIVGYAVYQSSKDYVPPKNTFHERSDRTPDIDKDDKKEDGEK